MTTVNIHEAKTQFSRLVDRATAGETIVIAKGGRPVARMVPLEARQEAPKRRIGFMEGQIQAPDDFNTMFADEIERMFNGDDD